MRFAWGYSFLALGPLAMTGYYLIYGSRRRPDELAPAGTVITARGWNRMGSALAAWTLGSLGLLLGAWTLLLVLHFAGVIELGDS